MRLPEPDLVLHQVLSGAGPYDAITREALAIRDLATSWGFGGGDHSAIIDPRVGRRIRPFAELRAEPGDQLLIHYSAYAPKLASVLDHPGPQDPAVPQRHSGPVVLGARRAAGAAVRARPARAAAVRRALRRRGRRLAVQRARAGLRSGAAAGAAGDRRRRAAAARGRRAADGAVRRAPGAAQAPGRADPRDRPAAPPPGPEARLVLVGEPLHERYYEALVELAAESRPAAWSSSARSRTRS